MTPPIGRAARGGDGGTDASAREAAESLFRRAAPVRAAFVISTVLAVTPSVHMQSATAEDDDRRFDLVSLDAEGVQGDNDSDRARLSAGRSRRCGHSPAPPPGRRTGMR